MATFNGTEGNDILIGGAAADDLHGFGGNDFLQGGDGADVVLGDAGNDTMSGNAGNDWLRGGTGNDSVGGGGGQDSFAFHDFGAANADVVTDFASNWDSFQLDLNAFIALGATGRFAAGDVRFFAGSAAHDADDRIIYNSATRQLWYDADGNGGGAAQLIATVTNGASISATDIYVFESATPPPPPAGTINGTEGNDTLIGTAGPDTINGLGGDDSIRGLEGGDSMSGGAGNDTLDGLSSRFGAGDEAIDTMAGGLGNDLFLVDNRNDVIVDAGGIDTVTAFDMDYTLGAGFENMVIDNDYSEGGQTAFGNDLANRIEVTYGSATVNGAGGNDTLVGGWHAVHLFGNEGNDSLVGSDGRVDWLDGGAGNDTLSGSSGSGGGQAGAAFVFSAAPGAANADLITDFHSELWGDLIRLDGRAMSQIGASGNFSADDERFYAAPGATAGHDADDRIIYNTSTGQLFYDADGSGGGVAQVLATLQGAPVLTASHIAVDNGTPGQVINGTSGNDSLVGTGGGDNINGFGGDDTLVGLAGDDVISGDAGNDDIAGGLGHDTLWLGSGIDTVNGGRGNDTIRDDGGTDLYVFDVAPGEANWDSIFGFQGEFDTIALSLAVFTEVGPAGTFSANDARFYAESMPWTGVQGHDADDRIVYNTNNGDLWYDADGSGSGEAQLIANLRGPDGITPANVTASDIHVMPVPINEISGTEGNDSIVGTQGDDQINGFGGNDTIRGRDGDDIIHGGLGIDTMDGGLGNDSFYVGTAGDLVIDAGGIDSVSSEVDGYQLGSGIENLFLVGNASTSGVGNGLDNWMQGNGGANTLNGRGGNDTVRGEAGNDSLIGSSGADLLSGGDGNDTLNAIVGQERLTEVVDTLDGGLGNDVYYLWQHASVEDAGGTDTLRIELDGEYFMPGSIEHLIVIGTSNDNVGITGNALANRITGSSAVERISGGGGNDALYGGLHNDRLDGGTGTDRLDGGEGFDELAGGGGPDRFMFTEHDGAFDSVTDFTSGSDSLRFENAAFGALGAVGRFAMDDARFHSAAGATAAHDADDRLVFDSASGNLYYDTDGSGGAAAVLVVHLQPGATLAATDIFVM